MSNRLLGIAVTLALILSVPIVSRAAEPATKPPAAGKPTTGPGREMPSMGNEHIEAPTSPHHPYNSDPPTSGPHVPYIAKWGVHQTPIPPELQVHNLEDGGVLIQYSCKNCDALVAKLEAFAGPNPRVIVAPYPSGKAPIALTAWGRIDTFDQLDPLRIERFIRAYMGIDHHPRHE